MVVAFVLEGLKCEKCLVKPGYYHNCLMKVIILVVTLPWNILVISLSLTIAVAAGALGMLFVMPVNIYRNCKMFCIIMSYWSSRNRFKKGSQKVNEELIMKRKEEEAKVARQTRPNTRQLGRNALLADIEREIVRPMPLL